MCDHCLSFFMFIHNISFCCNCLLQPPSPYLPLEFTMEGMLQRIMVYMEHQVRVGPDLLTMRATLNLLQPGIMVYSYDAILLVVTPFFSHLSPLLSSVPPLPSPPLSSHHLSSPLPFRLLPSPPITSPSPSPSLFSLPSPSVPSLPFPPLSSPLFLLTRISAIPNSGLLYQSLKS